MLSVIYDNECVDSTVVLYFLCIKCIFLTSEKSIYIINACFSVIIFNLQTLHCTLVY